jgi:hypothetical protein
MSVLAANACPCRGVELAIALTVGAILMRNGTALNQEVIGIRSCVVAVTNVTPMDHKPRIAKIVVVIGTRQAAAVALARIHKPLKSDRPHVATTRTVMVCITRIAKPVFKDTRLFVTRKRS